VPFCDSNLISGLVSTQAHSLTLFRFNFMLRNSPLGNQHEMHLPTLSSHLLGQLIKSLMMVYGSKTQTRIKMDLIHIQGWKLFFQPFLATSFQLGFWSPFTFLPKIDLSKSKLISLSQGSNPQPCQSQVNAPPSSQFIFLDIFYKS